MRPAERGLGNFHVGENFPDLVGFAQIGAEDGVDESGLAMITGAFGLLDGLVNSGVRWDAVEPENLVEAEPQEVAQGRPQFARGIGLAGDEPVERGLPAHDAADELVAEAAIGGRKPRGGKGNIEEILGEFAAGGALRQNSRRNLSWILVVQLL